MMHDHQVLIPAAFVSRPNRFVTKAVMGDAVVTCHMPNLMCTPKTGRI